MVGRMFGAAAVVVACCALAFLGATSVFADALGQPENGQLGLQLAGSTEMEHLRGVYDLVNIIIIAIAIFVLLLMLYVMYRFSESRNPTPSRTTHNTALEVAWTIIPILVLVGIAIPSFRLLYDQYSFPKPDLTIKATGMSWAWEHEYLDQDVSVSSYIVSDEDVLRAKMGDDAFDEKFADLSGAARSSALYEASKSVWEERGQPRKLTVDSAIAVPVNKVVHLLVTSADVIHSWTIPSFGVKQQAVPGRTAAVWFKPTKVGTFYGQCSVLCGKLHSAMPIKVQVVQQDVYDRWLAAQLEGESEKANEILNAAAGQLKNGRSVAQLSQ